MFQLEVDSVVVPDLTTNRLDMLIAKFSDPTMRAAQQELVQIEYGHIENIPELSFQTSGVSCDTAQVVIGRNHGEPGASRAAKAPQWRRAGIG
jgi:hypothetical protein